MEVSLVLLSTPVMAETPATPAQFSPQARRARRKALLVIAAVMGMLGLLWFGDSLSSLLPQQPYRAHSAQAGAYRVTLQYSTTLPKVGKPLQMQLQLFDHAGHSLSGAHINYAWSMLAMDMGTTRGTAMPAKSAGAYIATYSALMSGTWQLAITILVPNASAGTATFDVPIGG